MEPLPSCNEKRFNWQGSCVIVFILSDSIHDVGLKLTLGKLSGEFDKYNTVYFHDPERDMSQIIRRHFNNSSCVNMKYLLQANEKLFSVQSKLFAAK